MNEQIKLLWEEAAKTTQGDSWEEQKYYYYRYSTKFMERFAELIVKECASIALREDHDPYECILKHFGVETVDSTLRNRSTYFGHDL